MCSDSSQPARERPLERIVLAIVPGKKVDEVQKVSVVERPVTELIEPLKVMLPVAEQKLVRSVVHELHKSDAVGYDCLALTPCERGSKKSGDLDVLFF
jgi:hypothetical protein